MKEVNFIKSINVKQILVGDHDSVLRYPVIDGIGRAKDGYWLHDPRAKIGDRTSKHIVIPIHWLSKAEYSGKIDSHGNNEVEISNTYIAISEEVDELLGKPIQACQKHADERIAEARKDAGERVTMAEQRRDEIYAAVTETNFWQRLKYLFTGSVRSLE